ncbi:MAG: radical SAM protein [Acidobacteriota bacterium]|nr:radical SAM protein [Acidobacteriota bacterium]
MARDVLRAWGRILSGYTPALSIEITRECPLRCPGCYAFGADHLGGDVTLREVSDLRGRALVEGILQLVDRYQPIHVSLVGGEPLVRYRELNDLLPALSARQVHVQLVTSAVRPIPPEWASIPGLQICVSIDGLQPEHDARRAPATYPRILKHIAGHRITVHCTVTRQQATRDGYLEEFVAFWSAQPAVARIWISLYTPQIGEISDERLRPADRQRVIADLRALARRYPTLDMGDALIAGYAEPPDSPAACTFARTTTCVSADLTRPITPCQFGGAPDCRNCGCIASAGLAAVSRHRIADVIPVGRLFEASLRVGGVVRRLRGAPPPAPAPGGAAGASRPEGRPEGVEAPSR